MDNFINFLISYKDLLIYALLIFISLIQLLVLIFKKPVLVSDSIKEYILEKLPSYIIQAENCYKLGSEKFDFVVNSLIKDIATDFNLSNILVAKRFNRFIATNLEKILLTPHSKGGI